MNRFCNVCLHGFENAREDQCWLAACKHGFQVLIIIIIIIIIFIIIFIVIINNVIIIDAVGCKTLNH